MTIEQAVLQNLQALPLEKKQEVLDFVEFLRSKAAPNRPRRNPIGRFGSLQIDISEDDIAKARHEMWANFSRDIQV
jgi:hypothetical protein